MKNVLLITLWDDKNFGNRLQAIALKHMVDKIGYKAVCVPNTYTMPFNWRIKRIVKCILGLMGIKKYKYAIAREIRIRALKKSSLDYLTPLSHHIKNFEPNEYISPSDYYAAIVGSDQVWHKWTHFSKELEFFYLGFMPQFKRIAYAASFGFESFPKPDLKTHVDGLNGMHRISCREKSGCSLISSNTKMQADFVLDPTLCVERDFWDSIEQKPKFITKKYIFVMLLGEKETYYPIIHDFALKNNLDIVDITNAENLDVWKISIGQFIWLIHHAYIVCTDSFHCSVFSILYERRITIFRRLGEGFEHMYDRIKNLLDLCDLQMCEFDGATINENLPDYSIAKDKLSPMIKSSNQWLIDALDSIEKTN